MRWKNHKKSGWEIKSDRPEEIYTHPSEYYTDEEIAMYCRSGGMKKAQQRIAYSIISYLPLEEGNKILDIGCGPGHTLEVYDAEGLKVEGIDILPKMLERAKEKGFKVVQGDMKDLKTLFKAKKFDAVVSASALQWVKEKEDIKTVAEGIYYILKSKGKAAIQFYPKSEEELNEIRKIFDKAGFESQLIIENRDNPRKRTIFMILKKKLI
ncbi:MAG: methyltransferase domain-containing protein [Nanoarchaeota archaeon]|nr:methyltransferase domain-containing protein [Nanoarchaeota archaeon]